MTNKNMFKGTSFVSKEQLEGRIKQLEKDNDRCINSVFTLKNRINEFKHTVKNLKKENEKLREQLDKGMR